MRQFKVTTPEGIDAIETCEVTTPVVGAGGVRLSMKAASLNYRDLSVAQGGYMRNDRRPIVPLSDGAGEIVEAGSGVTRWRVGDRVSPNFVQDWIDGPPTGEVLATGLGGGIDGVLSEEIIVPERSLVSIPDSMSFIEAATVPCAAVTAWHALFHRGDLTAGQSVLLLGTGGVSIFALQMAAAIGAKTIVTSSSDEKLEKARQLGASETINYRQHDEWHKEVKRLTNGVGVDHVVEVGGPGTLERSLKSAAVDGQIHLIGVLDSPAAKVSPMLSVFNLIRINGIYVGSREMHEETLRFLTRHRISPVIDRAFEFEDSLNAYRHLASQKHIGKVIIEFGQ
ncbi:MAG: NAD(P)-dependent alcohol dehydrogenase [Planctomycetota bacterium]